MIRHRSLFATLVAALVVSLVWGCSLQSDVQVDDLELHQLSWEDVQLDVSFVETSLFGKPRAVTPEEFTVVLFDASYDTLYAGSETLVPVPDEQLGDRERLILEVCGTFNALVVCEQAGLSASPKRVLVDPDIEYPKGGDMGEGRYAIRLQVERQGFESGDWEMIDNPAPLSAYLVAYVEDPEKEGVRVPLRQSEGQFNLAQHANHSEFDFRLRSNLMNRDEVVVRFDVLASLNSQPARRVATVERPVRRLTPAERALEVGYFAEQAAEQILYNVLGASDEQTASVYIDEWNFMEGVGRYRIDMEVRWRTGFLGFNEHRLHGQLDIRADGSQVRFRRTDANRRAARLWDQHVENAVLQLTPIERPEIEVVPPPRISDDTEPAYDPTRHASRTPMGF